MATLTLQGSTSGQVTLQVPAVAGANTLTIPAATGTLATNPVSGTLTASTITSAAATNLVLQSNNGTTAMTIDTSQNVGIGTTSPSTFGKFAVTGAVATTSIDSNGVRLQFSRAATSYIEATNASGSLSFGTGGTDTNRMFIDSSGNVGIGTSSPGTKLEVSNGGDCYIRATGNIASGYKAGIQFYRNGGSVVNAQISATTEIANDYGVMLFNTAGASGPAERMRIDSSGNVGIGTTSPSQKLDIASSGATVAVWDTSALSAGNGGAINLQANNGAASRATYAQVKGFVTNGTAGAEGGSLVFATVGSGTLAERMRIDSSGNVGIGTSSPTSQFTVANATSGQMDIGPTATGAFRVYSDNTGSFIGSYNNLPLILRTNNTERLRITSSGAISVGSSGTATGTSGQVLTSAGSGASPTWSTISATGALIRAPQVLTSGTSYTTPSNCTAIYVECVGGGGGGGSAYSGASLTAACGGGGSGAYCAKYFTVTGSTAYTYAIGAGGGGGGSGGSGGSGGNTTFTVSATTITAGGGSGAAGALSNASAKDGGSGGTATNGDINITGNAGDNGVNASGGNGGSSFFGGSGRGGAASGSGAFSNGANAGTNGSGGGGAVSFAGGGNTSGTAGGAGIIRIWEFT